MSLQLRNWGNKKGLIRQHCLPSQASDRIRFWLSMKDKRGRALQPTFQPTIPQFCVGNTAGAKTPFLLVVLVVGVFFVGLLVNGRETFSLS